MLVLKEGKQVTDLIYEAKNAVVIPTRGSGMDGLCAGIALYRSLKNSGKNVSFMYPYPIPFEAVNLISKDEVTPVKGTRDLVVSID